MLYVILVTKIRTSRTLGSPRQLLTKNQMLIIECPIIKIECPEILYNTDAKYSDIYSIKIDKQIGITKLLEIAIRKPDLTLNSDE